MKSSRHCSRSPHRRFRTSRLCIAPPQYNLKGASVNIVLSNEQPAHPAFNGEVVANYLQGHRPGYGFQGDINYDRPKYSFDFSVDGRRVKNWNQNLNPQNHNFQLSFSSNNPPYWALSTNVMQFNSYSYLEGNPELKFSREYSAKLAYILFQHAHRLLQLYSRSTGAIVLSIFGTVKKHVPDGKLGL